METPWKFDIWNGNFCGNSQTWKLWEWPPQRWKKIPERQPQKWNKSTLSKRNSHKVWNLKRKPSEMKTFRRDWNLKGKLSDLKTTRKMHMFSYQNSFEKELSTLRNEHLNTIPTQTFFFRMKFWLSSHSPKPIQSPQARILHSDLSPPKKPKT